MRQNGSFISFPERSAQKQKKGINISVIAAVGLQWDNMWDTGNPRDELTPGAIMLMLVADIIINMLITWYVDQVMPGTYGVPKKFYFPFQVS